MRGTIPLRVFNALPTCLPRVRLPCFAAYGLSTLAFRSYVGFVVAVVGGCVIACDGVQVWLMWLGRT